MESIRAEGGTDKQGRTEAWAEALVQTLEAGEPQPYIDVLVQALGVGGAVFLALPGEVFAEIGLTVREHATVQHLFLVGYSNNGEVGYIPTQAAFPEGQYEVDSAPYYYGLFQLSPDCESLIAHAALRVIDRVSDASRGAGFDGRRPGACP